MVAFLLKFGIPLYLMYYGLKYIKNALDNEADRQRRNISDRAPRRHIDVIEICPECGHEKTSNHRCKRV